MNELWQEICFILQDIPPKSNEELYEQKIIQSLEKLGWSRFREEIILKQSIQFGSAGRIIPDIIVKSLSSNESFVIEVKKPSADIENETHKKQLFSYMRQLKLEHGLLIGNKIQIYYDGNLKKSKDPILLKSIDISETNQDGLLFIKLFLKESFSYQNLENFAEGILKEIASKNNKNKLYNLLISFDYKNKIQQFIIDDLQQNWDRETIENVMEKVSISISPKKSGDSTPINISAPINIPAPPVVQSKMKIGELVRENMNQNTYPSQKNHNEINKIKKRIPGWFNKPNQINSTILIEYLKLNERNQKVKLFELKENCRSVKDFQGNFNQMKNFGEKNHGKIFDENDEMVTLWPPVAQYILDKYQKFKQKH